MRWRYAKPFFFFVWADRMGFMNTREEDIEPGQPPFGWWDLCRANWFLLGDQRSRWFVLTFLLFAIHFYAVVPPLLVGKIVDFFTTYSSGGSLQTFYWYTGLLGGSFVIVSFARLSLKNVLGNLRSEVLYQIKVKGFERLLDFSLGWHLEESAGAKAQRIKNGVEAYSQLNYKLTNEVMRSFVAVVGAGTVFLFLRPRYALFFAIYVVIFWMIMRFYYDRIQKENEAYFTSVEKAGGSYIEGLSNILTIKTLGAASGFKQQISSKEERTKSHELVMHKLYNHLWKAFQGFNGISYGIFLFLVGHDVIGGHITPGALVIFYGYLQDLIGNAGDVLDMYETTLKSKSGVGRMMTIFWTKITTISGKKKMPKAWKAISLERVNFAYKKELPEARGAIKDLSISIPRGAKIGVVGKTGSGKSTLAKILVGLYPLASGAYTFGGTSFYDLTHEEQTKQITLVLQETEIFHFSLMDNITLMRETDLDMVERAIRITQLEEFVAKLPEGLNTLVGEKGYHLSGGERQRVGIARAICKDAPIIILDEATSSLDSKTEFLIQRALETELKDKTVISIAHRVSTLQKTDLIYVFDEGKIVEQGTFSELTSNKASKFYELYQEQRTAA